MGTTGRIYGTGGINVVGPGVAWSNPSRVDGVSDADYADVAVVVTTAEQSDYLVTTLPATVISGSLTAISLGMRVSTASPAAIEALIRMYLTDGAGTVIADVQSGIAVTTSPADREVVATLRNGATYADVQALLTTGITGAAGPKGLYATAFNTGTTTTFCVESLWYNGTFSGITGGGGATGNTKGLMVDLV